jgi:hypothetical protein
MIKRKRLPEWVQSAAWPKSCRGPVLPTIRELMAVGKCDRDLTWLMDSLQNAIALELSTIPPYLCAWWSIKDHSDPVALSLKMIWKEEMRHTGLACNLLAGIGGRPNVKTVVSYPGPLPGDVHPGLIAKLQGLTYDALHLFMTIEYPEFGPIAKAWTGGVSYPTIGDFYSDVLAAFQTLNPPLDETKQLAVQPGVFKVKDLTGVQRAIEQIKREGEGSATSPADTGSGRTDLAHYYRFGEVFYGKQIKYNEATKEWRFNGDPVPFPDVWPMAPTPPGGYQHHEVSYPVWQLLQQFDELFTTMLGQLQSGWDRQDAAEVRKSVTSMKALTEPAVRLMQMELSTRTGTYGPCFRLLPSRVKEQPMANRPTSYRLHIRPLFTPTDIDHMNRLGLDLASHDDVKNNSGAILDRLRDAGNPMPPTADGGPWPDEWIALFERWIVEGHPA